jgi:hypothetical protein
VLLSSSKVRTPAARFKTNFANLRNSTFHADYLLIMNGAYPGFTSLANSYASLIHQTYRLDATVIDVRDLYDEFGYGYPVPESMREFLKATTKWTAPMPSYVFLVGRANYDYKNYIQTISGIPLPNYVPVYGMPVSDPWIAKLDDSLYIPQMYVGRLPALSDAEFQRYIQHVQSYASAPYDDWNKRYIFFAGGDSSDAEIPSACSAVSIQESSSPLSHKLPSAVSRQIILRRQIRRRTTGHIHCSNSPIRSTAVL